MNYLGVNMFHSSCDLVSDSICILLSIVVYMAIFHQYRRPTLHQRHILLRHCRWHGGLLPAFGLVSAICLCIAFRCVRAFLPVHNITASVFVCNLISIRMYACSVVYKLLDECICIILAFFMVVRCILVTASAAMLPSPF